MPCTDCKVGEYSELVVASTYCLACPASSAGWSGRKGDCASCVPGKYKEIPGSAQCTDCGVGEYSQPSAVTCVRCAQGSYLKGDKLECLSCPANSGSAAASDNISYCVCNAGWSGSDGDCRACVSGTATAKRGNPPNAWGPSAGRGRGRGGGRTNAGYGRNNAYIV